MPKHPDWFKFHINDFEGSRHVKEMNAAEQGVYLRCMLLQWRDESIPDDPVKIARYSGLTLKEVRRAWPKVRAALKLQEDGTLISERLFLERSSVAPRHFLGTSSETAIKQVPVESIKDPSNVAVRASESCSLSVSVSQKGESEGGAVNPRNGFLQSLNGGADEVFEKLYDAHPKKKNLALAEQQVRLLYERGDFDFADLIFTHALWCRTEAWREKNGRFCPSLDTWLADRGYDSVPDEYEFEYRNWKKSQEINKNGKKASA